MKDGTVVALEAGQEPDRIDLKEPLAALKQALDLKEAFEQDTEVRIYLGIPKLKMGRSNVGTNDAPDPPRYLGTSLEMPDESHGGNDQEIGLRGLNVRLLLSTQDLSGHDLLPIAQIQRTGSGEATPVVDADYIPPLLAVDAWPPLSQHVVRGIYDLIGKRVEVLSQEIINRGISLASQDPGDLERVLMLTKLNEAYAVLSCMTFAYGVHPFVVYTELCRIVGMLSVFGKERRVPEVPRYDHDDLATIFHWVKLRIEALLLAVRQYEYEQRYFEGAGKGMQVTLESKWLNPDWNWYVGVQPGNITEKDCRVLLSAGQLDWKMGSSAQVDLIFKHGAQGVQLAPLAQAPRALPSGGGWIYYEVTRGNAAWQDVQATQTLAVRFKEALISNLDSLQGERGLVVSAGSKRAVLQLALFAVPMR
jgi:type VI secretion system protein ImpJ